MIRKYGVLAGAIIGLILFMFQLSGDDFSPGLKLFALLPLAVLIYMSFIKFKNKRDRLDATGVSSGIQLSALAGVTVILINLIIFAVNNEFAFSKYSMLPTTFTNFVTISAILFFEILVAGIMFSFISMQALKGRSEIE